MEKLLQEMLEEAKKSKPALTALKKIAIELKCYELASKIRDDEREFPASPEEKEAEELRTLFSMVDLNISVEACFIIKTTLDSYKKKKGLFDLSDASKIKKRAKEVFRIDVY